MKMLKTVSLLVGFVLPGTVYALSLDEFSFENSATINQVYWFTADDDNASETSGDALDYQAEFVPTWDVSGKVLWNDEQLLLVRYQDSFESGEQSAGLEINPTTPSVSDFGIAAEILLFFQDELPEFVSKMRVDYRRWTFVGKGVAQREALFVASDASTTSLSVGDELGIKADFERWAVTFPLSRSENGRSTRFGFYRSSMERPLSTSFDFNTSDLIVEMEINTTGLVFLSESETFKFNIEIGLADFNANQNLTTTNPFDGTGVGFATGFLWLPTLYQSQAGDFRFSAVSGLHFEITGLGVTDEDVEVLNSDSSGEEGSVDLLAQLGLLLHYRW